MYLITYQSARFLAPRCLLYRWGAEIRSTLLKGVFLISACYLYKRQPVHKSNQSDYKLSTMTKTKELSKDGRDKQECRPTQGWNGPQDHHQAAWWEGDNSWCNYSQMDETHNQYQSPSDWGSMQDLTSWSFNDHENGEESETKREDFVNDLKAAGTIIIKKTIGNTLRHEGLKSCSASKVPLVQADWSLLMIQRKLSERVVLRWDQSGGSTRGLSDWIGALEFY